MRSVEEWAEECGRRRHLYTFESPESHLPGLCPDCARAYAREYMERFAIEAEEIMALKGSYDVAVDIQVQSEYERAYALIQKLAALRALPGETP